MAFVSHGAIFVCKCKNIIQVVGANFEFINRLLQLATKFDFVAHALAATSADRLALQTKSNEAFQDASRYRRLALYGLHQAKTSISRENADAILAACFICSYQMSD